MFRLFSILFIGFTLTGCLDPMELANGSSQVYWISKSKSEKIPIRMMESVNNYRIENNLRQITLSEELSIVAREHSKDMYDQDRAWHFGSDGSSPFERVARSGFSGQLVGENISESFESDLDTLDAWMQSSETRSIILSQQAGFMGISWYQAEDGKIWWTQIFAK